MHSKRYSTWIGIASVTMVLLFAGCSQGTVNQQSEATVKQSDATANLSPQKGGTIKVAFDADPSTLDWMSTASSATKLVANHLYEQLFALDETMTEQPMLAKSYQVSEDQKTYTIVLRDGVKFHDGSVMTGADVVASLNRWASMSAVGKRMVKNVEAITAVSTHTVQIVFKEPYAPFIRNLADPTQAMVVLPAKIAEEAGTTPLKEAQIIGTGPYRLDSWKRGQRISLKRFDEYASREEDWGGLTGKKEAFADEIRFEMVPDAQVRVDGVRTGQYDFALRIPQDLYPQLKDATELKTRVSKPDSFMAVIPDKSEAPFDDLRMRQAVNHALDKEKIARATYGDFFEMDGAIFFPDQKSLYTKEGTEAYLAYDPQKAKALMKEAGYNGEPIRLIATSSYDDHFKTAQVVAAQLTEAGFTVDLQIYEWATLLEKERNPANFDLEIQGFSPKYDPTTIPWFYPQFPGKYESPKIMSLLTEWSTSGQGEQQQKLLGEFNRTVYAELPVIKITNEIGMGVIGSRIEGFGERKNITFWNTWLNAK
ncbi:ABC transporter substrate-binding protein [Brevibacillus sp. 179-C 1.1 NHS]|uniref:ABC transporter substrate-binding protein n=1 Tax=Brevibacillus sp. 179-C 1.1 NHS TaxID=3235177 RepID=UPI0039A2D34B